MPVLTLPGGFQVSLPSNVSIGGGTGTVNVGGGGANNNNAHIPAQNDANVKITAVWQWYHQARDNGQLTQAMIDSASQAIRGYVTEFTSVVNQVNTSRARQGLADIARWANTILGEFAQDRANLAAANAGTPNAQMPPAAVAPIGGGAVDLREIFSSPLFLVAVAFLLLRKK